jgi:hypothetical protein
METKIKTYRATFNNGPEGNESFKYDFEAENGDEAWKKVYAHPCAKKYPQYTDVTLEEVTDGPKVIGICYNYHDHHLKRDYQGYTFIKANDEKQAVEFYNRNIKGKHFYQPWPDKFDDEGNCEYGSVKETYYAGFDGYKYDATK